jgi:hypothetical protein
MPTWLLWLLFVAWISPASEPSAGWSCEPVEQADERVLHSSPSTPFAVVWLHQVARGPQPTRLSRQAPPVTPLPV